MKKQTILILENIRSAYNVGAMFRTADGAGVDAIYLVGYTPCPIDRFGRVQPEITKTSLGASEFIPWEYFETSAAVIAQSKKAQLFLTAIEQNKDAVPYTEPLPEVDIGFVVGNEVTGVSTEIVNAADAVRHIPMSGQKESLNVATTAGVILFHHRDRAVH